jgi:hypothetical protein
MSNTAHHTLETPEQLHLWLKTNYASETELWVRIFKKATGQPSVTWDDCVVAGIACPHVPTPANQHRSTG